MDKETIQLVVVVLSLLAFMGIVLLMLGAIGIGGISTGQVVQIMWDSIGDFITALTDVGVV